MIRYLRYEAEKYTEIYKKRSPATGEIRIDLMAHQCADELRKLLNENNELKDKLKDLETKNKPPN